MLRTLFPLMIIFVSLALFGKIRPLKWTKAKENAHFCPYFVYSKLSFPSTLGLWISHAETCRGLHDPYSRSLWSSSIWKNYVPYLHTLELSNLRIIVMKDVASISAKLVSILIKQTLFKSHTTSKSKCERFQFVEFKCSITNQMMMMIKVKHACWIDIIIAYSLQLYNRNENLQKRCIWTEANILKIEYGTLKTIGRPIAKP